MAAPASAVAGLGDRLEQTVAAFVKEHRLPGAAAGVVVGDELVWSGGYGFADVAGRRRPRPPRTLYRIASIPKTFTGTAIMQLRDAGTLHLDDPAVAHLPGAARRDQPVQSRRDGHDPASPLARIRVDGRSSGHRLNAQPVRRLPATEPGPRRVAIA